MNAKCNTDGTRTAYGPIAQRIAASLDSRENTVIFDHIGAAEALRDCVFRKFGGVPLYVRPVLIPEDVMRAGLVSSSIIKSFSDVDERWVAVQQAVDGTLHANGRPLREIATYEAAQIRIMQAIVRLSDGVIVSSQHERRRIQDTLKTDPPIVVKLLFDTSVPHPPPTLYGDSRDAVVIWGAPQIGDGPLRVLAALADLRAPLLVISDNPLAGLQGVTWFSRKDAEQALSRARVIVDTNPLNADSAVALARWRAALVVDAESGALERVYGARGYNRRELSSIYNAVVTALGSACNNVLVETHTSLCETASGSDEPLVSVLIPTFDRPHLLRWALESCRRQTYGNLEVIVAIGGARRYDDIVADFPEVRFIHLEQNVPVDSMNAAFEIASGEYIAILNDDDIYFPDHVSTLVYALEASQGMVAHSDVLTAFLRDDGNECFLYGFESNTSRPAERRSLLVANYIGAMSGLIRRSCLENQLYDVTIPLYRDYALWLRLSERYDIVHVERITSCYTIRNQGQHQQTRMTSQRAVEAFEAIYHAFPVEHRPQIEAQRRQQLEVVGQHTTFAAWALPAAEIKPVRWPPF